MSHPSRADLLEFDAAVRAAFAFLLRRGFTVVSTKAGEIRFESDRVFLEVWRDPYGYELDLHIGFLAEPTERLSLAEVELVSGLEASQVTRPESIAEMRAGLEALARTLLEADPGLLGGDPKSFERVGPIRTAYTAGFVSPDAPSSPPD